MDIIEELLFKYFILRMIAKYDADYTMRYISNHCVLTGIDRENLQSAILRTLNENPKLHKLRLDCIEAMLRKQLAPIKICAILGLLGKERWAVYNTVRRRGRPIRQTFTAAEIEAVRSFRNTASNEGGFYDRYDLG